MTELDGPYFVQPPVMAVTVEDSMDIMIVRDTVRRAGNLLGFSPADRAQLASAAATLAELVLKSGDLQEITLNGVRQQQKNGLQISTPAPWLENVSSNNVLIALRSKLGDLVDEILVQGEQPPVIYLVMWLGDSRREAGDEAE